MLLVKPEDLNKELARLYPSHYRFIEGLGLCRVGTWFQVKRGSEDGTVWRMLHGGWASEREEARWFRTSVEACEVALGFPGDGEFWGPAKVVTVELVKPRPWKRP